MATRTPVNEAKRQLTLGQTMYRKMLEKHQAADEAYREKLARLEAEHAALLNESSK